ncbi:MAG: hypothetical protein DCC75_08550 [Proteobacteria bacterium]|nr:MAG: hypothetical protein DCC75_08550 [Pseudomonadota bacterium]
MICRTLCTAGALYPFGDFLFFRDTKFWRRANWSVLAVNAAAWVVYFQAYRTPEFRHVLYGLFAATMLCFGLRCWACREVIRGLESYRRFMRTAVCLAQSIVRPLPGTAKGALITALALMFIDRNGIMAALAVSTYTLFLVLSCIKTGLLDAGGAKNALAYIKAAAAKPIPVVAGGAALCAAAVLVIGRDLRPLETVPLAAVFLAALSLSFIKNWVEGDNRFCPFAGVREVRA